jgi:hypothetical protein
MIFYNIVSELRRDIFGWRQSSLSRSMASCERVIAILPSRTAGQTNCPSSRRLINRHRPSASAQVFSRYRHGVPEDKQMAGEGILIQNVVYLFAQPVEGFTHIRGPGDQPDAGA